ncbi:MAG: hypothetical protein JSV19_13355 [Phycisphaerales bacterium]|nr:MAG: hypothetical protein JSV19_13355 [Phycisphaerales bacterium]
MMKTIASVLTLVALGLFIAAGPGCATGTGGGGGGGGGQVPDCTADADCTAGEVCQNGECVDAPDDSPDGDGDGDVDGDGDQDGDGDVDDDGAGDGEALVKTHIIMDDNTLIMGPKAGDDLIVWGDSETVYYVVPSETDSDAAAGTEVPEGARFAWTHFAIAGKKIALVTSLGEVRIFDTATGESRSFPASEILLKNTQMNDDTLPGLTQASGDYFATLNDTSQVADGNAVKVINVAGADPDAWEVISFTIPESEVTAVDQVAVDADSGRVAATDDYGRMWVWSINDPAADPQMIDMGLATDLCCVNSNVQMQFDGGLILFQQDPTDFPVGIGTTRAALLDVDDESVTVFDNNPTVPGATLAMAGGSFAYAQVREDLDIQSGAGTSYRSAIGRAADAPVSTLASQFDTYDLRPSNFSFDPITQEECFDDPKLIGYGTTKCVTPDGGRWFLAGRGPIDDNLDYLQMSTGGEFEDFADPEGNTASGSVMATDVTCSHNIVAFRALRQEDDGLGCSTRDEWVVGFIVLDRLDD